ncbi:Signal transduction response regulator, receiver domain protein [Metarhizium album ARSEF 1941]|uniref:Signal transduction response regulator, receiver domain protein n=1 Tax=Metarhizium album (strain ARSEF 1941) TaxID=1081103 RepID=A0A0B2X2E9_METAS|nr:Signal transduction response regulator, receiver domain protein [Metarhizium album ARSEF 1941]KHO00444.1 Signal transduction response regulator, receiver domain protein [Metarhizium album ARSEF 1941]
MASDIASRIKARLSRRRRSTGLAETSVSSGGASFASQTGDEQAGPAGHGAVASNENSHADGKRRHRDEGHAGDGRRRRVGNQGGDSRQADTNGLDGGQGHEDRSLQRFQASDGGAGTKFPAKEPLEQPACGRPSTEGSSLPQQSQGHPLPHPPKPPPQGSQVPQNNPTGSVAKDPPALDHDPSRPHPDPSPQPNPATAAHLPSPSQSTLSPPSFPPRASNGSTLASGDRKSPQGGDAGRTRGRKHNLRLVDIGSSGSPARAPPAHVGDDVQVDPFQPPQHGCEPDQLSFASFPAVASAAVSSSAASPAPFAPAESRTSRRQNLFPGRQTSKATSLLGSSQPHGSADFGHRRSIDTDMLTRKIWVKRPHASATTITVKEDDLVDDVRDVILRKYANSLGRTFDSPDLIIRVHPRDPVKERALGPEEVMARILDTYYPGGQTIDEALIIDVSRRTPKASPRVPIPPCAATTYYLTEDGRPSETGEGYFPPVVAVPSPHTSHAVPVTAPNGTVPHSIAVLGTGHIPPIPSPGATSRSRLHRERLDRPRLNRTHTSSPTLMAGHAPGPQAASTGSHSMQNFAPRLPHSRTHSGSPDHSSALTTVKTPMAKSPGTEAAAPPRTATPPPRSSSPRAPSLQWRRNKNSEYPAKTGNISNGTVPPINVLIVEDNPINMRLLEAFVKKSKVRCQTAMNGQEAVKKWRGGGFHLVLMDIQLPVMNGLDATREIRRLERVNAIGVFTSTPDSATGNSEDGIKEQDRLQNPSLFKSPVIIVALTASSLQSDRHEALAAGCNDFLTKPVNFGWFERKVREWGCMQALIDFDGWRKWKEAYSQQNAESEAAEKALAAAKIKPKKSRTSLSGAS